MNKVFIPATQAALQDKGRKIVGRSIKDLLSDIGPNEICIAHHYRGKTQEATSIEDKWDAENYMSEIRSGHIKHIAFYAIREKEWNNH